MSCFPGRSEFPHHICASCLLHHNWLQKPQNLLLCENTNSCSHVYNSDLRWAWQGNLKMIVKTASKCQTLYVHHSVYWGSTHFCIEVHWWHITSVIYHVCLDVYSAWASVLITWITLREEWECLVKIKQVETNFWHALTMQASSTQQDELLRW